jgi:long-chain acyl-CoA synthetase
MSRLASLIDRMSGYGPLSCIEDGEATCTYAEMLRECQHLGTSLDAADIRPGCVVGLQAEYSLTGTALLLAALLRACVVALIPRDRNVSPCLEDARVEELFSIDTAGNIQRRSIGPPTSHPLLDDLRRTGQGGIVLFTSGSTGRPKAALQSVERFLTKFAAPGRRFRTLGFLMFDHVAGLDTLFYTLSSGGSLIVTQKRDPDAVCALIESHRVEVLPVSPSFLRLMCLSQSAVARDLSSLKIITYGSEPMDPTTLALINGYFPEAQISQKYGTTETGSPKSVSRGNDSLWIKLSPPGKGGGLETRVVDGILWLRGESTILGYLNAPSPVDEAGWYCTGDLVEVDGEWLRFKGRAAEAINVGGEKVAPAEVEHIILELDFVRDVVVLGEKNALLGEIVTAQVCLARPLDPQAVARDIRRHCGERLARYKVPVKIAVVTHDLVGERQKRLRRTQSGPTTTSD